MLTSWGEHSTIFVIDGDPAVRDSLRALLEQGGHLVTPVASATEFLKVVETEKAACVVVDLPLADMSYQSLLGELVRRHMDVPMLLLTEPANLATAVEATKAGVDDVLARDSVTLVHRVAELVGEASKRRAASDELRRVLSSLTQRELEVLKRVVTGQSNKEIGESLGISFRTVEVHRKHLMLKTNATNVLELAKLVDVARSVHLLS